VSNVHARAVIDVIKHPEGNHLGNFKVEVWGREPHDYVRIYEIQAKSDTIAAYEGIQRFIAEVEAMQSSQGK
jgi:hypothetical protein